MQMHILETLVKLRDDIKEWVTNNLVALDAKIESKTIPIDNELKTDSTNPVQNKIIAKEIGDLNSLIGSTPVAEQIATAIANQPEVEIPNITDDESGSLNVADPNGNIIFKVDDKGVHTTNVDAQSISTDGEDFNIADPQGNVIFKVDKDGIHTTNISTTGEDFNIADSNGNVIFKVDAEGTHTTDVTVDGISIKAKMPEWDAKSNFSGDYNDLTNAPSIQDDESDNLVITDPDGNIVSRIDANGIETTTVSTKKLVVDGVDIGVFVDSAISNAIGSAIGGSY